MEYGIMFFSSATGKAGANPYRLLLEAARFADTHGFACVWVPERHFHEFGGLFPNPAVTGAALATITERLQIRAGSLISPLHHSIRIAEDWAVVDNLSGGRIALSFGSGWNVNDFVFFPERYERRQAVMYRQIEEVRRLWSGDTTTRKNSFDKDVVLTCYPKPVQDELPIWVTSSGHVDTFISAGKIGANILTHLIGQDLETLSEKIARYRTARGEAGYDPKAGTVTLMLHTYLGTDAEAVRAKVRTPFREYLRSAVKLEVKAAKGGGSISGGHKIEEHEIRPEDFEDLLDAAFDRYYRRGSLLGTVSSCKGLVWELEELGVNEIACLIDFLDDPDAVLEGLKHLDALRGITSGETRQRAAREALDVFMDDLDE